MANREDIVAAEWDDADASNHLPQHPDDVSELWDADKMAIVNYEDGRRTGVVTAEYPISVRR
jgi:hypothetical protein